MSLDGSLCRGFSPTEFVVTLPVLSGSDELMDYLPRRGEGDESSDSSSEEDKAAPRGGGTTLGTLLESISSDETDSEESRWNPYERSKRPSDLRKVAWA